METLQQKKLGSYIKSNVFMHTCGRSSVCLLTLCTEEKEMLQLSLTILWNSVNSQSRSMCKSLCLLHTSLLPLSLFVISHTETQTSFRLLVMRPTVWWEEGLAVAEWKSVCMRYPSLSLAPPPPPLLLLGTMSQCEL